MAYIESFLYYIAVITVALVPLLLIIFILIIVSNFLRGKSMQMPTIKKIYKWFVIGYFAVFFAFYLLRSIDYYGSDRAYPQAKAYAVVADAVSLFHAMLLNAKIKHPFGNPFDPIYLRVLYPEDPLDNQIQKFQSFLLKKMYCYIPEEDGERSLLYYKYKLHYKVRMMYASTEEFYRNTGETGKQLMYVAYLPSHLKMMDTMLEISRKLYDAPMRDQQFSNKDRYMTILQMPLYLTKYFVDFASLEKLRWIERFNRFENNETLVGKYTEYAAFLDKMYSETEQNNTLKQALRESPYTKGLFLAALLSKSTFLLSMGVKKGIDPCKSPEMKRYLRYHKAFYSWIRGKGDKSFKRLSSRNRSNIRNLFGFKGGEESYYIVGKYICKIPVEYKIKEEERIYKKADFDEAGIPTNTIDIGSDFIRY